MVRMRSDIGKGGRSVPLKCRGRCDVGAGDGMLAGVSRVARGGAVVEHPTARASTARARRRRRAFAEPRPASWRVKRRGSGRQARCGFRIRFRHGFGRCRCFAGYEVNLDEEAEAVRAA